MVKNAEAPLPKMRGILQLLLSALAFLFPWASGA